MMPDLDADSIFIRAYSQDLARIGKFLLPAPLFSRRPGYIRLRRGRTLGCFSDDVWWIYGEHHDASPRIRREGIRSYRPALFRERTSDWSEIPRMTAANVAEVSERLRAFEREASATVALHELDRTTRMLVYLDRDEYDRIQRGILVVSHEGRFEAVTTNAPHLYTTVGFGYAYRAEDPEESDDDTPAIRLSCATASSRPVTESECQVTRLRWVSVAILCLPRFHRSSVAIHRAYSRLGGVCG